MKTAASTGSSNNSSSSGVRIVTRDSNVEVRFLGQEPLLVGEWFPLRLELVNRETGPVTDIEVMSKVPVPVPTNPHFVPVP
jgi:hypothetical protein